MKRLFNACRRAGQNLRQFPIAHISSFPVDLLSLEALEETTQAVRQGAQRQVTNNFKVRAGRAWISS